MKLMTLIFLMSNNQVLLAQKKRGFGVGKWNGVGGKVEENETTEQALIRETQEEIDVTPTEFEKVANLTFDELHEGERKLMHVNVYTCTKWSGEPKESEEMNPAWFDLTKIPYDQMWSDDPYWLPKVLAGKKITADFKLNNKNEVTSHEVKEVEGL